MQGHVERRHSGQPFWAPDAPALRRKELGTDKQDRQTVLCAKREGKQVPLFVSFPTAGILIRTSVCLLRWLLCPLDTALKQSQRQTPTFHMRGVLSGSGTDRSNSAKNGLTWPAPGAGRKEERENSGREQQMGQSSSHLWEPSWLPSSPISPQSKALLAGQN